MYNARGEMLSTLATTALREEKSSEAGCRCAQESCVHDVKVCVLLHVITAVRLTAGAQLLSCVRLFVTPGL